MLALLSRLGLTAFCSTPLQRHLRVMVLMLIALPACRDNRPVAFFSTPDGLQRIYLEVAVSEEERSRGLMFRNDLRDDEGMLFVFQGENNHSFWMKNTYMSLDIIFMSGNGVVVDLLEGLPPCGADPCPVYRSHLPSVLALEVKAGVAARIGVRRGGHVRFEGVQGVSGSHQ